MQAVHKSIWQILGERRQENIFFKCYPKLEGKVDEVQMVKDQCPRCKQDKRDVWEYRMNNDWQKEIVWPICHDCNQNKQVQEVTQEMMDKRQGVLDKEWFLLPMTDTSGFKNFETYSPETTKAKDAAKLFTKDFLAGNKALNLMIMGSTGVGKTHLAKAVARTVKEKGLSVAYISSVDLFDKIKQTFGNDKVKERFWDHYSSFDMVVIDDVGLETKKSEEMSWSRTEWTKLIEARDGKSTVWTTNFDDPTLPKVLGQRAFSRMYMNTRFVDVFQDQDYRMRMKG